MSIIISAILIFLALVVIAIILFKKFPALAILDVANIPGEKELKFKEQLIQARVDRDLALVSGFFGRAWLWLSKKLGAALKFQQDKLKKIKLSYQPALKWSRFDKDRQARQLLSAAKEALIEEEEELAEEKILAAINLNQNSLAAFVLLGELYARQKKWSEARETYHYALKLAGRRHLFKGDFGRTEGLSAQEIYFSLAELEKAADKLEAAIENIRAALDREPASPRYLDLIIDLSIMKKDPALAEEFWLKLSQVNPDNKKLAEWREEIDRLKQN